MDGCIKFLIMIILLIIVVVIVMSIIDTMQQRAALKAFFGLVPDSSSTLKYVVL